MEAGSPAAIWERWTLPMLSAQRRYWQDNPPVAVLLRLLAAVHYKSLRKPARKTRKRAAGSQTPLDTAALHAPLSAAELAVLSKPGTPIR